MSTPIELGRFGRPHGIRGDVRLWPHNGDSVLLTPNRTIRVGSGPDEVRAFELQNVRRDAAGFVVHLKGIDDRNAAGSLNGMMWYENREAFPPADADEYYHVDLMGLSARLESGEVLGSVVALWDGPASDVLVIQGETEILVPFVENFLVRVDLAQREIILRNVDSPGRPTSQDEA